MNKKEAKELCILKWEYIVKCGGDYDPWDLLSEHPQLKSLTNHCAYCKLYFSTRTKTLLNCGKCPIRLKIKDYNDLDEAGCGQENHPFNKWFNYRTKKSAQAVLDLIKKS